MWLTPASSASRTIAAHWSIMAAGKRSGGDDHPSV
jgi:hypothetical protein